MIPVTRQLSEFTAGLQFDALPGEVVERTRLLALDHVGIALRARRATRTWSTEPGSRGSAPVVQPKHDRHVQQGARFHATAPGGPEAPAPDRLHGGTIERWIAAALEHVQAIRVTVRVDPDAGCVRAPVTEAVRHGARDGAEAVLGEIRAGVEEPGYPAHVTRSRRRSDRRGPARTRTAAGAPGGR